LRLWGYNTTLAVWVPLGPGADTTKGQLNEETAIGETITDVGLHAERVHDVGLFDRIYLEVVSIGGTNAAVSAVIVTPCRAISN
jgi:hypothetical protein